jgi:competence protein ComEC
VRGIGSRAGLAVALVIGERGLLDRRVRDSFTTLGIAHLLALSGLHLGFVGAGLVGLLRLGRVERRSPVLAGLFAYVAVVGFLLSLYRALVMAFAIVAARALHRPLRPVEALGTAFMLILVAHPYAIFSVGFQLSFLATLAVLMSVRRLVPPRQNNVHRRLGFWIRSTVEISAVVQVVLAPVLLSYFGRLSLVAPLTTVVFVVPVMIVMALSAVAIVVTALSATLGTFCYALLQRTIVAFEALLALAVELVPPPIEIPAPDVLLYYTGFALMWYATRRWGRLIGVGFIALSWLAVVS